ncbi:ATP-binding protein [uncultured Desulfosarcina sp.]|uniref:sensor histidine kinase n=1 Tax=uncultured Desulfosarcina sp. TaxID=218289 RepID=UPI0029C66948|nr:ATP-binding protein [uncultured Desulfosarcina sp.]
MFQFPFQKYSTDTFKLVLIAFCTLVACVLTYYFHAVLGIGTIISHFYYMPIILACIWWQRKGLWVAVFLVAFLLTSHQLLRPQATTANDYIRFLMLMVIAIVVAELSQRIAATQRQLKSAHDQMEIRVVKRTAQLANANRELELEIEQHRRTEERLALNAKRLEQRNEEIKNFAYIVSHDLRAPLINLKGFSAELHSALEVIQPVLQAHIPNLDGPLQAAVSNARLDITEALDFIGSSTNRMDSLINALLHLSRLGRTELKPESIDMRKKVKETLNTLAHQLAEKKIKIDIGPLPVIEADRIAMQQILGNLLNNAVLYSVPGREGRIEITSENGLDQVTFHVRDNGRGIAPEDMDKVFMPFRRVGRTDIPGEGMGLAYTQALVNRHGGHIQCRSKLDEGSTFSFTIPIPLSTDEVQQ